MISKAHRTASRLIFLCSALLLPLFSATAQISIEKPRVRPLFPNNGSVETQLLTLQELYVTGANFQAAADCRLPQFQDGCQISSIIAAMRVRDYLIGQISGYEGPRVEFELQLQKAEAALKASMEMDRLNGGKESPLTRGRRNFVEFLKEKIRKEIAKYGVLTQCRKDQLAAIRTYVNACIKKPNYASTSCELARQIESDAQLNENAYDECASSCAAEICRDENKGIEMCEDGGEDALLACTSSCLYSNECDGGAEAAEQLGEPNGADTLTPGLSELGQIDEQEFVDLSFENEGQPEQIELNSDSALLKVR